MLRMLISSHQSNNGVVEDEGVAAAFAKPTVKQFRDKQFPLSSIKTVLVMPVGYEIGIPDSEPFLVESAEQKWQDFTFNRKQPLPFVLRTPREVIDRASRRRPRLRTKPTG